MAFDPFYWPAQQGSWPYGIGSLAQPVGPQQIPIYQGQSGGQQGQMQDPTQPQSQQQSQQVDPMQALKLAQQIRGLQAPVGTTGLGPMAGGGGTSGAAGVHVGGQLATTAGPQVSSGAVSGGSSGALGGLGTAGAAAGMLALWAAMLYHHKEHVKNNEKHVKLFSPKGP